MGNDEMDNFMLKRIQKKNFIRIRAFTLLNAIWYLYKERFM